MTYVVFAMEGATLTRPLLGQTRVRRVQPTTICTLSVDLLARHCEGVALRWGRGGATENQKASKFIRNTKGRSRQRKVLGIAGAVGEHISPRLSPFGNPEISAVAGLSKLSSA